MTPEKALSALERRMNLLNQIVQEVLEEMGYEKSSITNKKVNAHEELGNRDRHGNKGL